MGRQLMKTRNQMSCPEQQYLSLVQTSNKNDIVYKLINCTCVRPCVFIFPFIPTPHILLSGKSSSFVIIFTWSNKPRASFQKLGCLTFSREFNDMSPIRLQLTPHCPFPDTSFLNNSTPAS